MYPCLAEGGYSVMQYQKNEMAWLQREPRKQQGNFSQPAKKSCSRTYALCLDGLESPSGTGTQRVLSAFNCCTSPFSITVKT